MLLVLAFVCLAKGRGDYILGKIKIIFWAQNKILEFSEV